MKFVLYTVTPSPHQFPLAREIVSLIGAVNFRYVYREPLSSERNRLGWDEELPDWCISIQNPNAFDWLLNAEVLISGERDVALFERRHLAERTTIYTSERWFKPKVGIFRLLHPRFLSMTWRFIRLIKAKGITYLPIGIYAAQDMARCVNLFALDFRCLFHSPKLEYVKLPGGAIYRYPWMRMWGYFVAPSSEFSIKEPFASKLHALRVIWVGRLLRLKRVDTLVKAVYAANIAASTTLTIVGEGPELKYLIRLDAKLARQYGVESCVTFRSSVAISTVRSLMRAHDVYVLTSAAEEGWGAVVNEALEEGMEVFGTYEAGSCATMLPKENLFRSGAWRVLRDLLVEYAVIRKRHCAGIGAWSAINAAKVLMSFVRHT